MPEAPSQLIEQTTRHAAYVERLKSHDVKQVQDFIKRMEKTLRTELSGDITEWTRARLERQLSVVRGLMRDEVGSYRRQWRSMITELAGYESEFELKSLSNVVDYEFSAPTPDQIMSAVFENPINIQGPDGGALLDDFFDGWTNREIDRVTNTIRMGYAQGNTTPQIIRAIRGSAGANFTDGALALTDRALETLTRTALQHAAVQARSETWRQNRDIVKEERMVATLDNKTSTICRSIDGQRYPVGEGPRPPFHAGCRTTVVAVLDERFSFLEKGGTRRARDPQTGDVGYAQADTTYYGWLKNQPATVQDSIIGSTRGRLLRNGGLSSQRFAELQLGRNFEPLTLQQMKDLEPVAFTKANIEV